MTHVHEIASTLGASIDLILSCIHPAVSYAGFDWLCTRHIFYLKENFLLANQMLQRKLCLDVIGSVGLARGSTEVPLHYYCYGGREAAKGTVDRTCKWESRGHQDAIQVQWSQT
jgi:hypothetical protein